RQHKLAKRNLRYELRLEGIRNVECGTHRLTRVWCIWQFVLFMRDIKTRALGICPQAVRLAAHRKKLADHLTVTSCVGPIDHSNTARGDVSRAPVIYPRQADIDCLPAIIFDKFDVVRPRIIAERNRVEGS